MRYEPSLIGAKSRPYLPELPVRPSVWAAVVVVGVDVWGGCEGRRTNRRLDEADEVTWVSAIDFELRQDSLALGTPFDPTTADPLRISAHG